MRDEKGRVLPGSVSPNLGGHNGRPKLPEWFKSRGPDALRVLLAQATGELVPCDDGSILPAVVQVAADSTPKERAQAADMIANRVYGKAPDVITGDGDNPLSLCLKVEFVKPGA
jgi:hypothetical protein